MSKCPAQITLVRRTRNSFPGTFFDAKVSKYPKWVQNISLSKCTMACSLEDKYYGLFEAWGLTYQSSSLSYRLNGNNWENVLSLVI